MGLSNKILITGERIQGRISELATAIAADTPGDGELSVVALLDGAWQGSWTTITSHPLKDSWWEQRIAEQTISPGDIQIPILFQTGWWDHNVDFSFAGFRQLIEHSSAGTMAKLVVGPWSHSTSGVLEQGDVEYPKALLKAMMAAGVAVPDGGALIATIADRDKEEAGWLIREFAEHGFRIHATGGTQRYLERLGVSAAPVRKISEGTPSIVDLIRSGEIDLVLNTLSPDPNPEREGARIRRASVEHAIPCLTSLDTARALLLALSSRREGEELKAIAISDYVEMAGPTPSPASGQERASVDRA